MAKKDFTIATERTYEHIAEAVTPKTSRQGAPAGVDEAAERARQMRTQGREGCKLPRITMGFTPDNYDFIRVMAGMTGMTMTAFVNHVLTQYREEHSEQYEQAKALKESL